MFHKKSKLFFLNVKKVKLFHQSQVFFPRTFLKIVNNATLFLPWKWILKHHTNGRKIKHCHCSVGKEKDRGTGWLDKILGKIRFSRCLMRKGTGRRRGSGHRSLRQTLKGTREPRSSSIQSSETFGSIL